MTIDDERSLHIDLRQLDQKITNGVRWGVGLIVPSILAGVITIGSMTVQIAKVESEAAIARQEAISLRIEVAAARERVSKVEASRDVIIERLSGLLVAVEKLAVETRALAQQQRRNWTPDQTKVQE